MAEPSDPAKPSDDKKPAKADDKAAKTDSKADKAAKPADKSQPAKSDAKPDAKPAEAGKGPADKSQPAKSSSVPGSAPGKPQAPAAKKSGGGRGALVFLVLIVLIGAGGYAVRDVWMPYAEPYIAKLTGGAKTEEPAKPQAPDPVQQLSARLAALEEKMAVEGGDVMGALKQERERLQGELDQAMTRIDDLERRLAEVREIATAVTTSSGTPIDLGPVMSRMDGLEESRRETQQEITALQDRIETMATERAGAGAGQGVLLAVAQLRDAALAGRPYAAQLDALNALIDDDPDLRAAAAKLSANAQNGLPTAGALAGRFSEIAGDIVTAARASGDDWLQQAAVKLSSLISIRRTDGKSGDPVEDAVADIEALLKDRNVVTAVERAMVLSDALPPQAKAVLEPWLLDAKARATAVRSLNAMHAAALAGLEGK